MQTRLRAVVGIVCGVLLFLAVAPLIGQAVTAMGWMLRGRPGSFSEFAGQAARFEYPAGMLAANLGIVALIPITMALLVLVNQAPASWVWSVSNRVRGRYLMICLVVAVVVFIAAVWLLERPAVRVVDGMVPFLIIIVFTSPFQAAAEEVFFRGYLGQAVGTLTGQTGLAIVLPALLFAFWHGSQNLPLIMSRFAFGVLAGMLAWTTGGLEASIAAHVANNLGSFLSAAVSGGLTAARTVTQVSWIAAGYQIGVFALFAGLAWLIARRTGVERSRQPPIDESRPAVKGC